MTTIRTGLLLTPEDLADIRARVETFPWAAALLEAVRADAANTSGQVPEDRCVRARGLLWAVTGQSVSLPETADTMIRHFKCESSDPPGLEVHDGNWGFLMANGRHVWAFDLLRDHPAFPAARRETLERYLGRVLEAKKKLLSQWTWLPNNTGFWDVANTAVLGALLDDRDAIALAIDGPFGFKHALTLLRDQRFWPEPQPYAIGYVIASFLLIAETSRARGGEDLYAYRGPEGQSIKGLMDSWLELTFADGRMANVGDQSEHASGTGTPDAPTGKTTRDNHLFSRDPACAVPYYEIAFRRFRDPVHAWILSHVPKRDSNDGFVWGGTALTHGLPLDDVRAPAAPSIVCPEYGCAILRADETPSYWHSGAPSLLLRKGNWMNHGHNDHFAIVLNRNGRNLYPDWFLQWDYCNGIFTKGRNRTPMTPSIVGHNTVVVDCRQPDVHNNVIYPWKCEGPFGPGFTEIQRRDGRVAVTLEGSVYADVSQRRTLVLSRDRCEDIFALSSPCVRTYDYVLHGFGELSLTGAASPEPYEGLPAEYGLAGVDSERSDADNQWLHPTRRTTAEGDWQAEFRDSDGVGIRAHFSGAAGTQVFLTATPRVAGEPRRLPVLIVRRQCRKTEFAVAHQPFG